MKWLTSLFMMLFAGLLVASPGLSVNVYAVDSSTPSGYSVDGVPITVYDAEKNLIDSFVTTKEGGRFIAPWGTKLYIFGSLGNVQYVAGDPQPTFVATTDLRFCRLDNNDCQKGEGSVTLKGIVRAQPEPKKEEKQEYQNTVYIVVRAVDEKTEQYRSNPGVFLYVVDANSGSILGSGVTDEKGVSIAVPVDTKFRIYSKDSKDGRAYGYADIIYYLQRSTTGYMGCQSGAGCESNAEFYVKAHPSNAVSPTIAPTTPVAIKPIETPTESRMTKVFVVAEDEYNKPVRGAKLKVFYSEYGKQGAGAVTDEKGGAYLEVAIGKIFYVTSNDEFYSDKYIVKGSNGDQKICDLSTGGDCRDYLSFKVYHKSNIVVPTVAVPTVIKPIPATEVDFVLKLNKGWNLVSVPLENAKAVRNSCENSKIFVYDSVANKYKRATLESLYLAPMQAFWIKAKDECGISFSGSVFKSDAMDGITLASGWNMLGSAANEVSWYEVAGSCDTKSGPWRYSPLEKKWERSKSLSPGVGYFVKLVDKCTLGSGEPPLPPSDEPIVIVQPTPVPQPTPIPAPQPTQPTVQPSAYEKLTIEVQDGYGKGVAGATVYLYNKEDSALDSGTTDSNGQVTFVVKPNTPLYFRAFKKTDKEVWSYGPNAGGYNARTYGHEITSSNGYLRMCSLTNNECSSIIRLVLYPTAAPTTTTSPTPEPTSGYLIDKLMGDDAKIGSDNAAIVIVEFSDFQCPFCSRFYQETLPQLESNYINSGRVQFVYRDYPLSFHQNAQKAAEAAECAEDQGKWREMHNLLFDKQDSWKDGSDSIFKEYAASLGLDKEKFNNCLDSGQYKQEVLNDFNDGTNAGVGGTPTFFIGKRGGEAKVIVGAQAYSEFKKVIEELN